MSKIVVSDFDLGDTAIERQMVEAAGIEFVAFGNEDDRAPEALIEHLQDADGAITSATTLPRCSKRCLGSGW